MSNLLKPQIQLMEQLIQIVHEEQDSVLNELCLKKNFYDEEIIYEFELPELQTAVKNIFFMGQSFFSWDCHHVMY